MKHDPCAPNGPDRLGLLCARRRVDDFNPIQEELPELMALKVAVGETAHSAPPLPPLVGVSTRRERGCQWNDSLADGCVKGAANELVARDRRLMKTLITNTVRPHPERQTQHTTTGVLHELV